MEKNNGQYLKNGFANQPIQPIHCILKGVCVGGGGGGEDGERREKKDEGGKGEKKAFKTHQMKLV